MHFYIVPDGRVCREKGQALRKEDERVRGEAVSSWWLVAGPAPSPAARCHLSQVICCRDLWLSRKRSLWLRHPCGLVGSDLLGLLAMIASDLILDELVGVSDLVLDVAFLCSAFWSFSVLPLDGLC